MTKGMAAALFASTAVLALVGSRSIAEEQLDPRIAGYDKGPDKVDVSKYPAEIQAGYRTFSKKCSSCHTLARAINCEFALPDEWERYVKRMMRKPNSGISSSDGKQIFDFLVYDSKNRKAALYEQKLKGQPQPAAAK